LDESTDSTGKTQLLAFSRFVCNGDINEQFFLFSKPLPETTVISVLTICHGSYISICTDNALSVSGSLKGYIATVQAK
jgi:hypothetical protein